MLFLTLPVAFLQLAFLPGFLILALAGLHRTNPGRILFLSAMLSGIFNMLVAYLLFAAGIFHRLSILVLLFFELEILLCLFIYRNKSEKKYSFQFAGFRKFLSPAQNHFRWVFLIACGILFWTALETLRTCSGIFMNWDAVLSWNRWAVEWASGDFPTNTRGYPQLAPLNWAVGYLLCGSTLEFIPHLTCHYLGFLVLLGIFDLGCSQKKNGLFFAVPLCAFFLANLTLCRDGGEADYYIIFYSFATIYLLFTAKESPKYLFLAMIAAAGAASVKQSGAIIWLLFPAALAMTIPAFRNWKRAVCYLLLGILIAGPYYTVFFIRNAHGAERTNYSFMVNGIYGNRTFAERGIAAGKMFFCKLVGGMEHNISSARHAVFSQNDPEPLRILKYIGRYLPMFMVLFLFLFLLLFKIEPGIWKNLISFWAIPYILFWHFSFSYDLRNLGPVIPLLACGIGLGTEKLAETKSGKKILAGFILLLLIGYGTAFRNSNFT